MSLNLYRTLKKAGIEILAADPVTELFEGRLFYNSTTNALRIYESAAWGDVVAASAPSLATDNVFIGNAGIATAVDTTSSGDIVATVAGGLKLKSKDSVNSLINGGFDIWQRKETAVAIGLTADYIGPDRWMVFRNSLAPVATIQRSGVTEHTKSFYAAMITATPNAPTAVVGIIQRIETIYAQRLAASGSNRSVSLMYYSQGATSVTLTVKRAITYNNFSSTALVHTETITGIPLNQWVKLEFKDIANAGYLETPGIEITISLSTWVGVISKSTWITDVMFSHGSGNEFSRMGGDFIGELNACRRYFTDLFYQDTAAGGVFATGVNSSSTAAIAPVLFPVPMRAAPTITTLVASQFNWLVFNGGGTPNCNTATPSLIRPLGFTMSTTLAAASGNSTGYAIMYKKSLAAAVIHIKAEL